MPRGCDSRSLPKCRVVTCTGEDEYEAKLEDVRVMPLDQPCQVVS